MNRKELSGDLKRAQQSEVDERLRRAVQLYGSGERVEAERLYREILQADPGHAAALFFLGALELDKGDCQSAVALLERAIEADATRPAYYVQLGNACRALGNLRRAAENYLQALRLDPQNAQAYVNLGNVFQDGGQLADAMECYVQAASLNPALAGALVGQGNVLRQQRQLSKAAACYRKALALDAEDAVTHNNLAALLSDLGEFDEALEHCRRYRELAPARPEPALFQQSLIELTRGEFDSGWERYESRWGAPGHDTPPRSYAQPLWKGERLSQGKLLLWQEQGIGDEIMFAGLLPEVLSTGNRCILECDARLAPIFRRSFPELEVVARPAQLEPAAFAAHLPCGSLPRLFRRSEADFARSRSGYLVANQEIRKRLRARYADGRPMVGLAWKTNSKKSGHLRSIALEALAPLFSKNEIQLVNLQYGKPEELGAEARAAGLSLRFDPEVDQMQDLESFAAQVAAMDLVVTIDNSTAHLAGALGVPVWLMLPLVPDWRWLLEREDSLWYPSLRIFRQRQVSDWTPVIEQVGRALKRWRDSNKAR